LEHDGWSGHEFYSGNNEILEQLNHLVQVVRIVLGLKGEFTDSRAKPISKHLQTLFKFCENSLSVNRSSVALKYQKTCCRDYL
jgi:hypothetical protein